MYTEYPETMYADSVYGRGTANQTNSRQNIAFRACNWAVNCTL